MHLQLNVNANEQTLEVRYTTMNDTGVDVYVQHYVDHRHLFVDHRRDRPGPTCFAYHLRPHELFLWAGTPPNPPATFSGQPYYAHAERLPPGHSLDVTLRLALPLLESGLAHCPDPDKPYEPVSANTIRFRLDVQPKRRGLHVAEYKHAPGTYLVRDLPPTMLEATASIEPAIIVHRRSDYFHRGGLEGYDPPF